MLAKYVLATINFVDNNVQGICLNNFIIMLAKYVIATIKFVDFKLQANR